MWSDSSHTHFTTKGRKKVSGHGKDVDGPHHCQGPHSVSKRLLGVCVWSLRGFRFVVLPKAGTVAFGGTTALKVEGSFLLKQAFGYSFNLHGCFEISSVEKVLTNFRMAYTWWHKPSTTSSLDLPKYDQQHNHLSSSAELSAAISFICGTPQGSALEPLFFWKHSVLNNPFLLYADDTTLC